MYIVVRLLGLPERGMDTIKTATLTFRINPRLEELLCSLAH